MSSRLDEASSGGDKTPGAVQGSMHETPPRRQHWPLLMPSPVSGSATVHEVIAVDVDNTRDAVDRVDDQRVLRSPGSRGCTGSSCHNDVQAVPD